MQRTLRKETDNILAQDESLAWLESTITTAQATHQLAHVRYLRARERTLQFPKDMQGTAAFNTATLHKKTDDDTLTTKS